MSALANITPFDPRSPAAVKPAVRPSGNRFDDLLDRQRPRFRHAQDDDLGVQPKRRRSDAATGGATDGATDGATGRPKGDATGGPLDGPARETGAGAGRANDNRPEARSQRGLSDPFADRADRFGGLFHFDAGFLTQVLAQEVLPENGARDPRHAAAGSAAYRATTQRTDAYLVPDMEELLVT